MIANHYHKAKESRTKFDSLVIFINLFNLRVSRTAMISYSPAYIVTVFLIVAVSYASAERIATNRECTAPNGERASCIQLENCTFLNNLLKKKPLLDEDSLFLSKHQCDSYNEKIFVCCPDRYMHEQQPQANRSGLLPAPGICGNGFANRVHGGTVANIDEFPWLALILYDKGDQVGHHCGGSLINNRYVLTAAHCLKSADIPDIWKPIGIRLGEWDTSTDNDCKVDTSGYKHCADPHVDVPIESTITHPNFASGNTRISRILPYDIGLIRLSRSVNYTTYIHPICLPIKAYLKDTSFEQVAMDIAGWGLTENGTASKLKMKAVVRGIPFVNCQRLYGLHRVQLDSSQMCAGGEIGISTCRGDSGGALIALDASNTKLMYYYAAGIISFGKQECTWHGWPGVYTKVSNYVDWIQENIDP